MSKHQITATCKRCKWMASEVTAWIYFCIFVVLFDYSCHPQENFMKLSFPFSSWKLSFTTALGECFPQSIPWISTHLGLQGSLQLIHHPNKQCCKAQYGIFHHPSPAGKMALRFKWKDIDQAAERKHEEPLRAQLPWDTTVTFQSNRHILIFIS